MNLHLGCGERDFGKGWIHIDGGDYPHCHSKKIDDLPFLNETADLIYASHVLEYWDREEAPYLLREWGRVLKKGGILRLAVPDFKAMATLYTEGKLPLGNFLGPLYGKMKMGDKTIYHKTVYDFDSLKEILESVGFQDVRYWDWRKTVHGQFVDDHSQAYLPHMDKENGILISLNMECKK